MAWHEQLRHLRRPAGTARYLRSMGSMVDRVRAVYAGRLTCDVQLKAYWEDWFALGIVALVGRPRPGCHRRQLVFLLVDEPTTVTSVDSLRRAYERIFRDPLGPDGGTQPRPADGCFSNAEPTARKALADPAGYPQNTDMVFVDTNGDDGENGERHRRWQGGSGQHVPGAV